MTKSSSKRKHKKDLLSASVGAGLTPDDKLALKAYKVANKTTYAALIRDALYATYPTVFRKHEHEQ